MPPTAKARASRLPCMPAQRASMAIMMTFYLPVKFHLKRDSKDEEYCSDEKKNELQMTKEFKKPCVGSTMEPDIIPEKHYYKDMSDSIFKVIEVDQSVNTSLTIDDASCKYRELRSGIYYRDDPPLITTPLTIQITKTVEIEKLDIQSTVETPLISSINPILQQFSSPNKKAVRVSTQV
ncbi:uncharacterized protein CDAR_188771 [Caerostris darwini]|uniref:Uncharacterized protein n=1 Tax=Caerostris darwini TaxID=1538125 RepID=A0AAV4VNT3_9ARAC|nr:uncharacterized protein CDAR_188771 [Caerostris darwini]